MKNYILTILLFTFSITSYGQTFYKGLERMCSTNNKGKVECYDAPRKWYHENTILIENDSIFIYKTPLHIVKGRKLYSASDGAFYYYYGIIKQIDTTKFAYLTRYNCDYCAVEMKIDTTTGYSYPKPVYDTLKIIFGNENVILDKVIYTQIKLDSRTLFPAKSNFYLDSNSISRRNPKRQYKLISQGIKNFIQTKELRLDNDTLRICLDRYEDYEEKKLIERLNPDLINIDTPNIVMQFYTNQQLEYLIKNRNKPIRVIKIKDIIDYWKAGRISLEYKILLPKSIHNFSEREYNNLFEYNKVNQEYELIGDLPENSWGLKEQK
jgi:hypothetical protein